MTTLRQVLTYRVLTVAMTYYMPIYFPLFYIAEICLNRLATVRSDRKKARR
jgi:hypothetical protein